MIPVFLNVSIILPGLYMEPGIPPNLNLSEGEFVTSLENDGYAYLENEARKIYSVDRNKVLKYYEDANVKDGFLAETLLAFNSLTCLQSQCSPPEYNGNWLNEDYDDSICYEENMLAIYQHVRKDYDSHLLASQVKTFCQDGYTKHIGPKKEYFHDFKIINFNFIACFQVHTSQGYEDLYPEIDCIEFSGEGRVELITNN